jgi:hypothetical protein
MRPSERLAAGYRRDYWSKICARCEQPFCCPTEQGERTRCRACESYLPMPLTLRLAHRHADYHEGDEEAY